MEESNAIIVGPDIKTDQQHSVSGEPSKDKINLAEQALSIPHNDISYRVQAWHGHSWRR